VIGRLSDMGIEPYLLKSGLLAIVAARLVRKLCTCARAETDPAARLGLAIEHCFVPVGCDRCGGTGYQGRLIVAEMLLADSEELGAAILARADVARIERAARAGGMVSRWERAAHAVETGQTAAAEIRRVLGVSEAPEES